MRPDAPRIERDAASAGARLRLSGDWSAARLAEPGAWAQIQAELALGAAGAALAVNWDLRDLQRLDHTGAQVLWNAWGHQWPAELSILDAQRAMLARVAQFSGPPPPATRRSAWQVFLWFGSRVWLDLH